MEVESSDKNQQNQAHAFFNNKYNSIVKCLILKIIYEVMLGFFPTLGIYLAIQ
jgi:hypothetical protein